MTNFIFINGLIWFENVIGIYRNYMFLGKTEKCLAKFHYLLEICVIVAIHGYVTQTSYKGFFTEKLDTVVYIFSFSFMLISLFQSLLNIGLSFYTSNDFKKFYLDINAVHKTYQNNFFYQKKIIKQRRKFYLDVTLLTVELFFLSIVTYFEYFTAAMSVGKLLTYTVSCFHEFRYSWEDFVFNGVIESVVTLLKFLNAIVSSAVKKVRQIDGENHNNELRYVHDELLKCGKASQYLVTASDHLNNCFGTQVKLIRLHYNRNN